MTISRIAAGRTDLVFDHLAAGGEARACDGDGVSLLRWHTRPDAILRLLLHGGQRIHQDHQPRARTLLGRPGR
jgi:hypothetical protein